MSQDFFKLTGDNLWENLKAFEKKTVKYSNCTKEVIGFGEIIR